MSEKLRLSKVIARSGIASRREAEKLIKSGEVKVNGVLVTTPVFFVSDSDLVTVKGLRVQKKSEEIKIWKFYKPRGVITSNEDPKGRPVVFDYFKRSREFFNKTTSNHNKQKENSEKIRRNRLIYIGRLDYNSEGLLLFTNSGDIARKMELPKYALQRTYRVRIFGNLNEESREDMQKGRIVIDGVKYGPAIVENERKSSNTSKNQWIRITISEGKNREIRKIMKHFGCSVNRLIRVSYGPFKLGNLLPGEIKPAELKEMKALLDLVF